MAICSYLSDWFCDNFARIYCLHCSQDDDGNDDDDVTGGIVVPAIAAAATCRPTS